MLRNKASIIGTSPVYQKYTTTLLAFVKKYIPGSLQRNWLKTFPKESVQAQIAYLKEKAMALKSHIQNVSQPVLDLEAEIHLLQSALQIINNAQPTNFRTHEIVKDIAEKYELNLKNLIKENLLSILNKKLSEAQYLFNELESQSPCPVSSLKQLGSFLKAMNKVEKEYQAFFSLRDDERIQNKKEGVKQRDRGHSTQKIIQTMQASSQTSLPLEMPVVSTSSSSEFCSRSGSLESLPESAPETSHSLACANLVTLSHSVPSSKHKSKYSNFSDHKISDDIFDFDLDEAQNFSDQASLPEQDNPTSERESSEGKEKNPIVFIKSPEDETCKTHENTRIKSNLVAIPMPGKRY